MRRTPLGLAAPALLVLCGSLGVAHPAAAESVEPFYKGRTIELLTTAPGGRYDLTSRLVARHFGDFLPGRPKVIVQVEPGAGGLTVANRLANTSPRDGSVLALAQPASWQLAIEGDPNARFDPAKMTWIGSMSSFADDADLLIVRADHAARSVADLQRTGLSAKLGAGTAGSTNLTFALLARDVLGLHVDVVRGYPGAPNLFLAMQLGELTARRWR